MEHEYPQIPEELKELFVKGGIDSEIRLDKNGSWFHNGERFTDERIIDFFNRSIDKTSDGTYVIHYDEYTYPIIVEDAPVFVINVWNMGFGKWEKNYINLSTGTTELLDIHSLYYKNNTLYCRVLKGRMTAKFKHSPFFRIMERLDEVDGNFYLTLCGELIHIKQE